MGIFARKPTEREENTVGYELEGRMQEICSCKTFCPVLGRPRSGRRDVRLRASLFHFDRGHINGVEVAGINMAFLGHLPGNIFDGGIRVKVLVNNAPRTPSRSSCWRPFTGKVGGQELADLAGLIGEITWRWSRPRSSSMSTRAAAGSAPGKPVRG